MQLVAFVVLQLKVALLPLTTLAGDTVKVKVGDAGGGDVTMTVAIAMAGVVPLAPAHASV